MAVDGFDGLFFFSKYDEAIKAYDKAIRLEIGLCSPSGGGNYGGALKPMRRRSELMIRLSKSTHNMQSIPLKPRC
jgi:hypothetical protein